MELTSGNLLLVGSILLLISIVGGKTSSRFGVPTLIFFLLVGIGAGSEGLGGIYFDNPLLAQFVGITALNFILFSGGLDTHWSSVRPVLWRGIALSTLGVFVTALSVGLFVHYFLGFTLLEGLLLGSIVSSTDAAAVFSILRNKGVRLKHSMGPLLELESGSNDPMAYFLTITFTALVARPETPLFSMVPVLLEEFLLGSAVGFLMGKASVWVLNRIQLDFEGLYAVLLLGLALFTYSITDFIGGNGFLAIYLSAVVLGNSHFIHKRSLIRFYEGQAWLMQIILFLTLGLLVFPSRVLPLAGAGLLISAFLIFIARPLGVFASLSFFKTGTRSKLFLSWVGLRGAVPIVFATYPMIAGLEKSGTIFNLVFFISVTSVLLQGTTLAPVARWLGVALPSAPGSKEGTAGSLDQMRREMKEVVVPPASPAVGKRIVELHIPSSVHIMAIERDGQYLQPVGATRVLASDRLFLLADDEPGLHEVLRQLQIGE